MKQSRKNSLSLFRRFDRTDGQPVAKGDGLVGENDWRVRGSMWPSKKGNKKDGSPWQVWNVTLQPAQGETRALVAVPQEKLAEVLALIGCDKSADGEGCESPSPQPSLPF